MGGLSKKAFQIKNISTGQHKPYLFVDSGNLLFKQPQIPAVPSQEQLTAEGIIKIYTAMKVDAVAVAPLDLAAGLALLQTSQKQGFPWLSANLLDQKGTSLFPPLRIKKIGRIKAGIIGLTGTVSSLPAGVTLADWQTVLPALVKKASKQCDVLILLSSLSAADNQEIARQFPALHLILSADLSSGNMNPQQVNNTLITQTERQGKYQGILTIDWQKGGQWGKTPEEELTLLRNRLAALDWQIQRMRQREEVQQPDYLQQIEKVEQERKTVEQQLKSLEHPLPQGPGNNLKRSSTFTYNFLALQQSMPEAPEIKTMVTDIKQQIDALRHPRNNKEKGVNLLGFNGCKGCHRHQAEFWQTTRHAKAYQTLQGQGQARNLECLPCHVTISRQSGGVSKDQILSLPPDLQTMGCENCHGGPGSSHAVNPQQFPMTRQVAEKTCRSCHTTERDNRFEYLKKKALIACPAG